MKRLWVAVALLLICGALSVTEFMIVQKSCNYYSNSLDIAESFISSKEYKKALSFIEKTQHEWQSSQKTLNIFLLHEESENIAEAISQLKEHTLKKEQEEFISLSQKTKRQLLCLKQSELPDLSNIL